MTLTEEEAKKKICPVAATRGTMGDNCLGSACMAWRWSMQPNKEANITGAGYCGLVANL